MLSLTQCRETAITLLKAGRAQHEHLLAIFDDMDGLIDGVMTTGLSAEDLLGLIYLNDCK